MARPLFGIGVLMVVVFLLGFTRPYNLINNGEKAWQTIATLGGLSPQSALLYILCFALLFGLYAYGARQLSHFLSQRSTQPAPDSPLSEVPAPTRVQRVIRSPWLLIGGFALLFNVVLLPLYPVDAADIYDYIIRGRMTAVYGLNPLRDTPNDVMGDPFFRYTAWRIIPSAYGPGWEILAGLTSRIAGDDNLANVIAFKLLAMSGSLLTAFLIYLTLRHIAPERAMLGVYLFAWNPLVIFVTGGTGHHDALMAACIVLSVYCLLRRWYVGSVLGALLGTLVKFIPILLVPIIVIVALRDLPTTAARIRFLGMSALLGGLLIAAGYAPFWTGTASFPIDRVGAMFTGSMATVARQALEAYTDPTTAASLVKYAVIGLFGVFYLAQLLVAFRRREALTPIRAIAAVLLFYLLVACTWFQAWYVVWVIGLAALLDDSPLRRLILVFSYLVTWESLVYNYVTLRYTGGWAPLPWRDMLPVLTYMGVAWVYVAWLLIRRWLPRPAAREQLPPLLNSTA